MLNSVPEGRRGRRGRNEGRERREIRGGREGGKGVADDLPPLLGPGEDSVLAVGS